MRWIDRVVVNGETKPNHLGEFETRYGIDDRQLHNKRQRSAHTVDIYLVRVQALGFQKELVRQFVGELDDLVFNRRTIPRPRRLNLPAVHRRAMHVLANDAMRLFGGERDVARHLRVVMGNAPGAKAEWSRVQVARLPLEA